MEFEVVIDHFDSLEWTWSLYELNSEGKRAASRNFGFQPFKSWALLAAKSEARRLRKKNEWRNQTYYKKI